MNEKRNALDLLNNAINILKGNFSKKDEVVMITSKVKFKFEIVETAEGATISYPSLEVGAPVTQASNEGESPANDGWYAVEGDIKIKVEGGLIAEIEQPEAETNEEFEEGAEAPVADNTAVVEAIEQAVEAVQAIQEEIEVLKSEFSQFNKVNADILALTDAVQKFSKEPISTSVTKTEEKEEQVANSKEDRIKRLAGYKNKNQLKT
ncbi:hypothetical protein [Sphingobacterium daejeonense]|uniref:hypothetical protein n=1 Tax=Sphingobacterium daejeonense TaxID=371142 RepID=UPI0010C3D19E|nr:hypothetical protein [Sphingobacterium daejeonense]VTP97748.1 Uncharacterised protein [Sphingobacterium daejeonense]